MGHPANLVPCFSSEGIKTRTPRVFCASQVFSEGSESLTMRTTLAVMHNLKRKKKNGKKNQKSIKCAYLFCSRLWLLGEQFAKITLSEGRMSRCCFKCRACESVCFSLACFPEVGVCFVSHARTCRATNTRMIDPRSRPNDRSAEVSAAFTETSLPTVHVFSSHSSAVHLCLPPFELIVQKKKSLSFLIPPPLTNPSLPPD